jgi:2-hydroxy-3-keto-5-methylthiopentenyl-1-phosphate phosphatase
LTRALPAPSLPSVGAPVSILVDYDGTVSSQDVGDLLLERHVDDQALVRKMDRAYDDGLVGSRDLVAWDMEVLPRDARLLHAEAEAIAQDDTFPAFVRDVRAAGALVEIVSDGLGFYVASNLARLDPALADLPVATNANAIDGPAGVSFPYGHPTCFVCGTCKRERVRCHGAGGRAVIFVGDGTSDRYAAHHADIVFAKRALLDWGRATGRHFLAWDRFAEIGEWFEAALRDGRLPATRADLGAWRATHRPEIPGFICGPEAWGEGRTHPAPTLHDRGRD